MKNIRLDTLASTKKILIKIGSAVLTGSEGLDLKIIDALVQEMCDLTRRGFSIVLVTSGAIASGKHRLNIAGKLRAFRKSKRRRLSARDVSCVSIPKPLKKTTFSSPRFC